jgi:glycosyltransferase involved in cell wall biosynthesis
VVPISEFNRRIIVETCGGAVQENLVVIHCGVDTEVFHPAPEALRSGPLSIVCTGTLHEVKGQKYLLEACRRLAERDVPFSCELIGDGPDRAALRRQAEESGIADRVRFHGQRTRDEVAVMIRNADVLVAPSVPTANGRREGIPVVLMEAIASGAPVVASAISGIPELVEDGEQGFLVPPRDSFALADVLERLYRNPALRRRLGAAGRLKALREFDLETNAAALAQRFTREARR